MVTPDSLPLVSQGMAFYVDKKDEQLLVAFDVFLCCPRCRIDAEAYNVILLCDGTNTIKEIAEKVHQEESKVNSLVETLLEQHVVKLGPVV
jgi:predicted transcriptional regulator